MVTDREKSYETQTQLLEQNIVQDIQSSKFVLMAPTYYFPIDHNEQKRMFLHMKMVIEIL
jgi:hypothetical protein